MVINKINTTGIQDIKTKQDRKDEKFDLYIKDIMEKQAGPDEMIENLKKIKEISIQPDWKIFIDSVKTQGEKAGDWISHTINVCATQADILLAFKVAGKMLMASAIGSAVGAVGLGILGTADLRQGIKEKDKIKTIEGTSALIAGTACAGDYIVNTIDGAGLNHAVTNRITGIAGNTSIILGVTAGAIDMVLSGNQVIKGIKNKKKEDIIDGSLGIGIGGTQILASLSIGGPVTAVALASLLAARLAYDFREEIGNFGKKIIGKTNENK